MIARPAATMAYIPQPTPTNCGSWATKMRIASALTNPTMTARGTKRILRPSLSTPKSTCSSPVRIVAAKR